MDRQFFARVVQPLVADPDPRPTIDFLKNHGLLRRDQDCSHCGMACIWVPRISLKDSFGWRCMNKNCTHYKSYLSIRTGSFFAKSHIPLQKWLHLLFLWCNKELQGQSVNVTGVSAQAMVDVYDFFRDVCSVHFQQNPIRLGGRGLICQLDESQAKHKSRIKSMKGVRREHLESYLAEFMWRDRYQASAFQSMMTHISSQFRWCNVYSFFLFHMQVQPRHLTDSLHYYLLPSLSLLPIICCLRSKFYYSVLSFMVRFTCFLWNKMLWFFFVISVNTRTLTLRKTETFCSRHQKTELNVSCISPSPNVHEV